MMAATPDANGQPTRLIARLVVHHTLQAAQAWRRPFGADTLSGVAWPTIDLSNIEPVFTDREMLSAFAGGRFSDADRRSIAVRALGAGMGLDSETVRRCVRRLVNAGYCDHRPDGVVARSDAYGRPEVAQANALALGALSSTFQALAPILGPQAAEFSVLSSRPWEREAGSPTPVSRLFGLLYAEYVLRFAIENLSVFEHNFLHADIFGCVLDENNRPLRDDEALAWTYAEADTPPPDEVREPISLRAIARRQGYPVETTRRHANRLIEMGYLEKRDRGLVVPTEVMARPQFVKLIMNVSSWFFAMIRKMDRLDADRAALEAR